MPGLDSGRLADAGSARGRSPEDSFDPASVSHPGTGSIRVWTGSINAIRAPIAREERPAPVFSEPASPASGYDRPSAHATEPDQVLGRPGALEFDYPPPGVSDGLGHVADRPEPVALEPFGIAPAVPSFAPAEPVQPFAAQPAQPPLFDPGLAEEFAGLLGQAPPGGPLEFLGEEEQPAMPPWETSGWLTDASYAPDPGSTTLQASFRPIDGGGVVADAPEMAPSDADDDETDTEFAGPPPFLPDGRPPWMEGPDARRIPPRGRQGRWVLQAILWVVAGIALGAAIWAATALLGDAGIFASGPGSGGAVEIAGEAGGG
jgi:hypothetical protein